MDFEQWLRAEVAKAEADMEQWMTQAEAQKDAFMARLHIEQGQRVGRLDTLKEALKQFETLTNEGEEVTAAFDPDKIQMINIIEEHLDGSEP